MVSIHPFINILVQLLRSFGFNKPGAMHCNVHCVYQLLGDRLGKANHKPVDACQLDHGTGYANYRSY